MSIRVLLVDDQQLVRIGFRMILQDEPDIDVVGEAADGRQAVDLATRLHPDVVVMDIRMPVMDGVEATRRLTSGGAATPRVLILTTFDADEYVVEALRAGASGFVLKDVPPAEFAQAYTSVRDGLEKLKSDFKQQNPDVILLDTFAPIAIQHIAAALRGDLDKREFASRFEVTQHERSYIVRLDVMKECDVRVEAYHLGDNLHAETILEQHIPPGPFEARIDESKIHRGLNMILVILGGSEFYFHRIEGIGIAG